MYSLFNILVPWKINEDLFPPHSSSIRVLHYITFLSLSIFIHIDTQDDKFINVRTWHSDWDKSYGSCAHTLMHTKYAIGCDAWSNNINVYSIRLPYVVCALWSCTLTHARSHTNNTCCSYILSVFYLNSKRMMLTKMGYVQTIKHITVRNLLANDEN